MQLIGASHCTKEYITCRIGPWTRAQEKPTTIQRLLQDLSSYDQGGLHLHDLKKFQQRPQIVC